MKQKNMRILLQNRDELMHNGGDMIQLHGYERALNRLGHEARYEKCMFDTPLKDIDEVWLFHINFGWTWHQYQNCRKNGKPYVLHAIFYPTHIETSTGQMREMIINARKVYALSTHEKEEMTNFLQLEQDLQDKIVAVPNGADKTIFNPSGEVYHLPSNEKYILSVGRLCEDKGHLSVTCAGKRLGLKPLVAGIHWDNNFKQKLIDEGATVVEDLSQEELAKYYRGATCYVSASDGERNGLTPLEAAACGTPVVCSDANWGNEWNDWRVYALNNEPEMDDYIKRSIEEHKQLDIPSWEDVVKKILA